ncbi:hypothetical protein D2T81_02620 [Azospirillum brasilense]|nr:hypothetical protein D2T81_02620 [Azospirillum brasilense]
MAGFLLGAQLAAGRPLLPSFQAGDQGADDMPDLEHVPFHPVFGEAQTARFDKVLALPFG